MTLWTSLEFVQKINSYLLLSWVVISAIFGLIGWKVQMRIEELTKQNEKIVTDQLKQDFKLKLDEREKIYSEKEALLKQEIEETKKKIKPPELSLISSDTKTENNIITCTIKFKSSKNQPLGTIQFVAELPVGSESEITDFWPTTDGGAFQSGKDSKQIAQDKKSAQLIYSLMGAGTPTMELKLTKPSRFRIRGNYISKPIEINAI